MTDPLSRYDFDSMAHSYDQWYETAEGKMYDRLEKKAVLKYLPKNGIGMTLLEVGCGTGHWSQFFAHYGYEVTGIDISGPMIKTAQSKTISDVTFQAGDGHALPFNSNSFDITVAITTFEFVWNVELVLREMLRCTRKPGGYILVGALNASAQINHSRRNSSESPYARARWFTPGQIRRLLEPFGRVDVTIGGFIPRWKSMLRWSPFIDMTGRLLHLPYGAFIAAEVMT